MDNHPLDVIDCYTCFYCLLSLLSYIGRGICKDGLSIFVCCPLGLFFFVSFFFGRDSCLLGYRVADCFCYMEASKRCPMEIDSIKRIGMFGLDLYLVLFRMGIKLFPL